MSMETILETKRFILRPLTHEDMDGMFALDSDPEVHRYLGNRPVTNKEELSPVIDFIRQQYVDHGIGRYAIIDKQDQEFVGWAGLKFMDQTINGHLHFYDLGYRLRKPFWGKGIATETSMAWLHYAFDQLELPEVFAMAHVGNSGSNNVLYKLGFQRLPSFSLDGEDHHWYRMGREEFLRNNPR